MKKPAGWGRVCRLAF